MIEYLHELVKLKALGLLLIQTEKCFPELVAGHTDSLLRRFSCLSRIQPFCAEADVGRLGTRCHGHHVIVRV